MIDLGDFRQTAEMRLADARALMQAGRYDGAVYMSGYAVEIALKVRMGLTLQWNGFPESGKEFSQIRLLHTHNLDALLRLSGVERAIRQQHLPTWSVVATWDPQVRYNSPGTADQEDAESMLDATENLLNVLL